MPICTYLISESAQASHHFNVHTFNGPRREKTCLQGFANNTGADQPAHPRSLISAYVIRFLKSIISKLASREIFNFLASLCSLGDWFESYFVGNLEDRFSRDEAQIRKFMIQVIQLKQSPSTNG